MQFVDLKTQYQRIQSDVMSGVERVFEHGRYIMGPEIDALETQLAKFCGVNHAIAVSSGTDALLMSLMALGIKAGDEVICPAFSFIATAEVIVLLGAKPVFVDIDPRTYNIDPNLIKAAITPNTKAIMPVALYGQCADMAPINAIADQHGLPVIEDAAQSLGATYQGKKSGNLSTVACTSFFPSKPLGCYGDGGACFTNDAALADTLRQVRDHGQNPRYHHVRVGINGRMDSVQAAILLAKLAIFPEEIQARQAVAARYDQALSCRAQTPTILSDCQSIYAQYTIEVAERDAVQAALTEQGIPTAVHYPLGLPQQPVFADLGHQAGDFPVTERAAARVLSLPIHAYLSENEQTTIIQAIQAISDIKTV